MSIKWKYLLHRYQFSNDIYHWPQILSTTAELGPVFHTDYSENITQAFKYELQSSHFNKKQYSLHCTVKHEGDKNYYLYHLSGNNTGKIWAHQFLAKPKTITAGGSCKPSRVPGQCLGEDVSAKPPNIKIR